MLAMQCKSEGTDMHVTPLLPQALKDKESKLLREIMPMCK
jgi:hypothetical protein